MKQIDSHAKRRSWCQINLSTLRYNLKFIRRQAGPAAKILALVKANAYGHGLLPTASLLAQSDCQILGCASLDEALLLRKAKIRLPILLLGSALTSEYTESIRANLILTISSLDEARGLHRAALKIKKRARVHLKIDTGMGRLGALPADTLKLKTYIDSRPLLRLEGIYSHYACSDTKPEFTQTQWRRFEPFLDGTLCQHISNSADILNGPIAKLDAVRAGLALYGISPNGTHQDKLKPALSWYSRLTLVREIPKGHPISYGSTYRTPKRMKIGAVAVGYGDGMMRSLSNKGVVLVNGKRCPILGRVTMDQILIALDSVPGAKNGTPVTLLGKSGKQQLLASEVAHHAGTIPYEIWTHITSRVHRIYTGEKALYSK